MVPLALGEPEALVAGVDEVGCALGSSEDPQPARSTIALAAATKPPRRVALPTFMISSFRWRDRHQRARRPTRRVVRLLAVAALTAGVTTAVTVAAPSAFAVGDGCYQWNRPLREGSTSADATASSGPGTRITMTTFTSTAGLATGSGMRTRTAVSSAEADPTMSARLTRPAIAITALLPTVGGVAPSACP